MILTVLWAAIYACVEKVITPWMGGQPIQWDTVLPTIVEGHYHMWYLYMLVGLYLATPFLREIVKKKNKNLVLAFIGLCLLFQFTNPVITVISHFLGSEWKILSTILGKFSFGLFGSYTGYYLTGWYLAHIGPESTRQRRLLYALGITGLASVLLYTHFTGEYKVLYNNLGCQRVLCSEPLFTHSLPQNKQLDCGLVQSILWHLHPSPTVFGTHEDPFLPYPVPGCMVHFALFSGVYTAVLAHKHTAGTHSFAESPCADVNFSTAGCHSLQQQLKISKSP